MNSGLKLVIFDPPSLKLRKGAVGMLVLFDYE
jgi:hypothetical protein